MTKLADFIAQVRNGVAKSTHFTVQLNIPQALNGLEPIKSNMNKIILFCDQAQIPGISFGTNQIRSYGEFKEVPYEKLFEPVTLSFYVDSNLIVKKLFDEWISLIQNKETRDFNYPNVYITDKIDIIVENTQGESVYKVSLNKCYPKAVAPIQLDYAAKDVMKMNVTIAYQFATMQQLNRSVNVSNGSPLIDTQMGEYNYGYESFAQIPNNYFNNFASFQNQYSDFSIDGVKSLRSYEDIGARTGFGGIFN